MAFEEMAFTVPFSLPAARRSLSSAPLTCSPYPDKARLSFSRRRVRQFRAFTPRASSSGLPSDPISSFDSGDLTGSPAWKTSRAASSSLVEAIRIAVRRLDLDYTTPPSLVLVYVAGTRDARKAPRILQDEIRRARVSLEGITVLGCTSETVANDGFSDVVVDLSAAWLPGVRVHPWMLDQVDLDWRQGDWWNCVGCGEGPAGADTLPPLGDSNNTSDAASAQDGVGPVFLILAAAEFACNDLLAGLDFAFPRSPKVGAVAGAPVLAGDSLIFGADGYAYGSGVVGVALERVSPGTLFEVVVAQGARPIGPRVTVTNVVDGSEIMSVQEETGAGVSVLTAPMQLLDMWTETGIVDKEETHARMYLGVDIPSAAVASATPSAASAFVMPSELDADNDSKDESQPAETENEEAGSSPLDSTPGVLVRRCVGVDSRTKSVAVSGPPVRLGVGARFYVRDARSVECELEKLREIVPRKPVGGILITDGPRVELAAEMKQHPDERFVFGGSLGRLVGESEMGPLPAPGFSKFFPIREPGSAASSFEHSSSSVYLLVYEDPAANS